MALVNEWERGEKDYSKIMFIYTIMVNVFQQEEVDTNIIHIIFSSPISLTIFLFVSLVDSPGWVNFFSSFFQMREKSAFIFVTSRCGPLIAAAH